MSVSNLEATRLRDNRYAVHPAGQLGTCGWYPRAWSVVYVNARDADQAIRKALRMLAKRRGEVQP